MRKEVILSLLVLLFGLAFVSAESHLLVYAKGTGLVSDLDTIDDIKSVMTDPDIKFAEFVDYDVAIIEDLDLMLDERVTTFVYRNKALIVLGDCSNQEYPQECSHLASDIEGYLEEGKGISSKVISSEEGVGVNWKELLKSKPVYRLVYSDDGLQTDLILMLDIQTMINNDLDVNFGAPILYSEVDNVMREELDEGVTVFVYKNKVLIILGDCANQEHPRECANVASDIEEYLDEEKGISSKIRLSDDARNANWKDLIGEVGDVELEILDPSLEENEPINIPQDSGGTLVVCNGCELEGKCYPISYRKSGDFCSDDANFVAQLNSDVACENSFECESNVCVSDKCVSGNLLQKIIDWFRKLFG